MSSHREIGSRLFLPWWEMSTSNQSLVSYLSHAMIGHAGEGLLLDQGSPDNLQGSAWAERVKAASVAAGRPPPKERKHVMQVGGVGQGTTGTEKAWCHNIALPTVNGDAQEATYDAPVVPSETIPGLLGLKTQRRLKAIIDTDANRMIVPGPGGVKIHCSPGTVVYQGYPTVSGHMMFPCTEFDKTKGLKKPVVLLTGVSTTTEASSSTDKAETSAEGERAMQS